MKSEIAGLCTWFVWLELNNLLLNTDLQIMRVLSFKNTYTHIQMQKLVNFTTHAEKGGIFGENTKRDTSLYAEASWASHAVFLHHECLLKQTAHSIPFVHKDQLEITLEPISTRLM